MGITKHGLVIFAAAIVAAAPALAEDADKEAVIVSMADGSIAARTRDGDLTVVLTPTTKISERSGLVRSKDRDAKSLIPGLIFKVKGDLQGNTITAQSIEFKDDDWRAAVATKAGTTAEFSELRKAIIDGQEYAIQAETAVYFATGSANIADQYKANLRALAQKAPSFGNYRISILGFADAKGNAEANERLSRKRAVAVSDYVRQSGLIEPARVLSPSAMGEGTVAPGETAPTTDAEARRVVVRVVTPKGQLKE